MGQIKWPIKSRWLSHSHFSQSVTLFLVALADIAKQVQEPVEIVGYADDLFPYKNGTNKHTICAEQSVEVDEKKRFQDIAGKNDSHAH
jgi:hypothetical protein